MTTDELWQAVIDAPDLITREEASRTYVDHVLSLDRDDRRQAVYDMIGGT
jgi:hypothetical protein